MKNLIIALVVLVFIACKDKTASTSVGLPTGYTFVKDSLSQCYGPDCQKPDSLKVNYLIINKYGLNVVGGDTNIANAIRDTLDVYYKNTLVNVSSYAEDSVSSAMSNQPIDVIIKKIVSDHQFMTNESPDMPNNMWTIETYVDTVAITDKVIVLNYLESTYLGGAHPNTFVSLLNFDKKTGKTIALDDIIIDPKQFLSIAEQAFRRQQELKPNENLEAAGYFFDKGIFALPLNYAIQQDGLHLFYNPYEAASYAQGSIDITIAYDQLGQVIDLTKVR
jgi:hypothetical protein